MESKMSFTTTMAAPQASGASAASGLRRMLAATAKGFRAWSAALERHRTQRLLASLDDRTLRDIGLSRSDVMCWTGALRPGQ
jgi:uncharacterized protein YjiS (DUF1127 family)